MNHVILDSKRTQVLGRAPSPTGKLNAARIEIARLRYALKIWVALAAVSLGFAVLLAFEVLALRDQVAGVL